MEGSTRPRLKDCRSPAAESGVHTVRADPMNRGKARTVSLACTLNRQAACTNHPPSTEWDASEPFLPGLLFFKVSGNGRAGIDKMDRCHAQNGAGNGIVAGDGFADAAIDLGRRLEDL